MKKAIVIILLALAIIVVCVCFLAYKVRLPAEEGKARLRYKAVEISESPIYLAIQHQSSVSEKPAQLKDLPKEVSPRVSYFVAKLGGRDIPLVLTHSKTSRLYLDMDGDGYLSDERAFAAKTVRRGWFGPLYYYRFGPISVEFADAGRKVAKKLYVITGGSNVEHLYFCPGDYRKGKVRLGQYVYDVAVVDGNFDGRYGKIFSPPVENVWRPGCDSFAIDLNRDGKVDFALDQRSEVMPLSRMVKIGNIYYGIDIDPEGNGLELKRVDPEFGTLDLGDADAQMKLWSDASEQCISYAKKNWQVPAGKYVAVSIELRHIDTSGNRWLFSSSRRMGKLKDFEIRPGQTTLLRIGPPFLIKTTAEQNNKTVLIGFWLEGQSGEWYGAGATKNDRRISAPLFKIIDEAGGVLHSGRFRYG